MFVRLVDQSVRAVLQQGHDPSLASHQHYPLCLIRPDLKHYHQLGIECMALMLPDQCATSTDIINCTFISGRTVALSETNFKRCPSVLIRSHYILYILYREIPTADLTSWDPRSASQWESRVPKYEVRQFYQGPQKWGASLTWAAFFFAQHFCLSLFVR